MKDKSRVAIYILALSISVQPGCVQKDKTVTAKPNDTMHTNTKTKANQSMDKWKRNPTNAQEESSTK